MINGVQPMDPAREYFTVENCHILELSNAAGDARVPIERIQTHIFRVRGERMMLSTYPAELYDA